jgi:transcription termination/antitermination protein NusG
MESGLDFAYTEKYFFATTTNQGERVSEPRVDPWLVLRTRSRHEGAVESALEQKQINAYLPKRKVVRCWNRQKRLVELPLFPGYVFVQPRADQYESMRYIRGSCGFVRADCKPATMPAKDLEAVKMLVNSGTALSVDPELTTGKRVRIVTGPFMGVEGDLVCVKGRDVLVINVQLVSRSVRVEVDREAISVL